MAAKICLNLGGTRVCRSKGGSSVIDVTMVTCEACKRILKEGKFLSDLSESKDAMGALLELQAWAQANAGFEDPAVQENLQFLYAALRLVGKDPT